MAGPALWLVLGASSSIARAFIRLAAAEGAELILAGRDVTDMERTAADARLRGAPKVDVRRFDAADTESHATFVDAIVDWNRMYGRRGFHQFQALLPQETSREAVRDLLATCAQSRAASFLAVLKTMGREGAGLLSFGGRGHTVALDFPAGVGIDDLLLHLERLVLDHGGLVYLAKDSRLTAAGFAAMYPRLPEFRRILEDVDPAGRMTSDLARRLAIRGRG